MRISNKFIPNEISYCIFKGNIINLNFIPEGYRVKYFEYVNDKYVAVIVKDRHIVLGTFVILSIMLSIITIYNVFNRNVSVTIPDTMIYRGCLLSMNIENTSKHDICIDINVGDEVYSMLLDSGSSCGTVDIGFTLTDIRSIDIYIYSKDTPSIKYHKVVYLNEFK